MEIKTKYNVGDVVYFIKDSIIYHAPVAEINIRVVKLSPHHTQTPNQIDYECEYVFNRYTKSNSSYGVDTRDSFSLKENRIFSSMSELSENSCINNSYYNKREDAQ